IRSNEHVRAVAPYVMQQVFVRTEPEFGEPAYAAQYVRGIDAQAEGEVSIIPRSVVQGDFNIRGNRILVGEVFARNMNLHVGDRLVLMSGRDLEAMDRARKDDEEDAVVPGD